MHFATRDLQTPRYFLGIEFAYQLGKLALSQRKYALELLQVTRLLGCKPSTSPLEARPKFWNTDSAMIIDTYDYWRLLGKLIDLKFTYPDITCVASVLSHFMQEPIVVHVKGALRDLVYLKHDPGDMRKNMVVECTNLRIKQIYSQHFKIWFLN